jgi:hypothetical protein
MATDVTVTKDNIRYTTQLETTVCGVCHIPFALPADLLHRAHEDKEVWFWCPSGHKLHYAEDENDRLKRQLAMVRDMRDSLSASLTHERDQHQAAKRQAAAYKGQLTRARKRAGAGVCPVTECHRTVSQLASHMQTKHPDYQP